MSLEKALAVLAVATSLAFVGSAHAQTTQPYAPPPVYPPQPPAQQPPYPYAPQPPYPQPQPPYTYPQQPPYPYPQQQPQYVYPQQPQYAPPPAYQRPPKPRSFREGDPVPPGYHVEERARSGLITGGWTLLLIPYGISALSAIGTRGDNATTWLYAPVVGPWFVLGNRTYSGCGQPNSSASQSAGCVGDAFAVTGLVLDGLLQAGGMAMLLIGYLNPRLVLVPNEPALRVLPMRIGSGHGVGLRLTF